MELLHLHFGEIILNKERHKSFSLETAVFSLCYPLLGGKKLNQNKFLQDLCIIEETHVHNSHKAILTPYFGNVAQHIKDKLL